MNSCEQQLCGYFDFGNCLYANGQFRELLININQRREIGRRIGQLEASQISGRNSEHHDEIYQLRKQEHDITSKIDAKKKALQKTKPRFGNYHDKGYTCKAQRRTALFIFNGDITQKGIGDQQNCSRFYPGPVPSLKTVEIF